MADLKGTVSGLSSAQDESVSKISVRRVAESTPTMAGFRNGLFPVEFLHEISSRIAAADPFHEVLTRVLDLVTVMVSCESCFVYVMEEENLILRASQDLHADLVDHLGLRIG